METTSVLLIGLALLLLAWVVYKKFVALPPSPIECETRCVDGVCFPSCQPTSTNDTNQSSTTADIDSVDSVEQSPPAADNKKNE